MYRLMSNFNFKKCAITFFVLENTNKTNIYKKKIYWNSFR